MKVLLFTNTTKELTSQAIQTVCAWCVAHEVEYEFFSSGIFEEQDTRFAEVSATITNYDLVCSFGGDGTTLRAAHLIGRSGVPLLSFKFGTLGFLSGASEEDLEPAMQAALEGKLEINPRAMLELKLTYEDGCVDEQIIINELVVSRGHFGRIIALDLSINGTFINTIRGDGILVSTATGSTGYALSAGGPIVSPTHEGLSVVPIAPHTLTTRALVCSPNEVVTIVPNKLNSQKMVLFIDGEVFWIANPPSNKELVKIELCVCPEKLLFTRYGSYDFYEHVSRTFFRGDHA